MIWQTSVHWKYHLTKNNIISEWQHVVKIYTITEIWHYKPTLAHQPRARAKKMMSPLLTLKHTHYRLDLLVQFYCPWQTVGQAISHRASSHCFLIQTVRGWHLRPVYGILSYLTFSSAKPEQVKVYSSPVTCTHLLRTKAKKLAEGGIIYSRGTNVKSLSINLLNTKKMFILFKIAH